ncbi:MAG: 50S ribosomal protein L5 [Gammaproteobacteria bacterium]
MSRQPLQQFYVDEVVPKLVDAFGYKNVMQVPKLVKVTLNMGVGEAAQDKKAVEAAAKELAEISGQKPIITKARKAVASFKIREGWPIGCKVTLRGHNMHNFLWRLIHVAIPRIRDFRGLSKTSFDGRGNYAFGIKELIMFPEIDYENVDKMRGMDICVTTTATRDEEALALLRELKFPIRP